MHADAVSVRAAHAGARRHVCCMLRRDGVPAARAGAAACVLRVLGRLSCAVRSRLLGSGSWSAGVCRGLRACMLHRKPLTMSSRAVKLPVCGLGGLREEGRRIKARFATSP